MNKKERFHEAFHHFWSIMQQRYSKEYYEQLRHPNKWKTEKILDLQIWFERDRLFFKNVLSKEISIDYQTLLGYMEDENKPESISSDRIFMSSVKHCISRLWLNYGAYTVRTKEEIKKREEIDHEKFKEYKLKKKKFLEAYGVKWNEKSNSFITTPTPKRKSFDYDIEDEKESIKAKQCAICQTINYIPWNEGEPICKYCAVREGIIEPEE